MKAYWIILCLLSCNLSAGTVHAQPPQAISVQGSRTGVVEAYGSNPDGDIDKLLLKSGEGMLWLHFPPHTARAVLAVAKINTTVTAVIHTGPGPAGKAAELAILYDAAGQHSARVDNIPPPPPDAGVKVNVSGRIDSLQRDREGLTVSIIIGQNLVLLPPHVRNGLANLLQENGQVTVSGKQRSPNNGFVNERGFAVIRPDTLTLKNIHYLIR